MVRICQELPKISEYFNWRLWGTDSASSNNASACHSCTLCTKSELVLPLLPFLIDSFKVQIHFTMKTFKVKSNIIFQRIYAMTMIFFFVPGAKNMKYSSKYILIRISWNSTFLMQSILFYSDAIYSICKYKIKWPMISLETPNL